MTQLVKYQGITLEIEYTPSSGEEPEDKYVTIDQVYHEGFDIMHLLNETTITALEKLAEDYLDEMREAA